MKRVRVTFTREVFVLDGTFDPIVSAIADVKSDLIEQADFTRNLGRHEEWSAEIVQPSTVEAAALVR